MTQHMILEKRNIGNPLFQRFCGWRENKNKRGATILSSAQPAWGGCGSACRSRYWKQMNLLCAAELHTQREREQENERGIEKDWKTWHSLCCGSLSTLKQSSFAICFGAPLHRVHVWLREELMGGSLAFVTISEVTRPKQ